MTRHWGEDTNTRLSPTTCIAQKLKDIILAHNLPLGSTPTGKDWCIKALHPSDPLTEVRGIPDESALPSIFLNYQTTYSLTPPAGSVDSWAFNMALVPSPIVFGAIHAYDAAAAHTADIGVRNAQIPGAAINAQMASLSEFAERWRLAYAAVTVYQDAPSLADQGTIVAAQYACQPREVHFSALSDLGAGIANTTYIAKQPIHIFDLSDLPSYSKCQSMPNAYFSKSKEGAYMPLKLTNTSQHWHSVRDAVLMQSVVPDATSGDCVIPAATAQAGWPYLQANEAFGTGNSTGGWLVPRLCNDSIGAICATNLALTTNYTFFFRFGFEIQPKPGTSMTSHQKLSPPLDRFALDAYYAISREMKDAYPADYNDLGAIWDTISGIASSVLPALVSAPHPIAKAIGGIGMGVKGIGDTIRSATKRVEGAGTSQSAGNTSSAGDVELAKAVVDQARQAASAPPPPPPPPPSNLRALRRRIGKLTIKRKSAFRR